MMDEGDEEVYERGGKEAPGDVRGAREGNMGARPKSGCLRPATEEICKRYHRDTLYAAIG